MAVDTTIQVVMPQMGDSVTEGTILEWRKAEGDTVSLDETLVEISTDKVDAEVPAPASGTVVKIHAAEGDTVTVGQVIAEIESGSPPSAAAPAKDGGSNGSDHAADGGANGASGGDDVGAVVDIVTPAAGESVTEGTILEWTVKVGDVVKAGDTVVEISTDKVDVELPAPVGGTISELLVGEGDTVTVGQVIGRIASSGGSPPSAATPASERTADAPPVAGTNGGATNGGAKASPVARRVAGALDVNLGAVSGSGPGGRIVKADVLDAAAHPGANGAATAPAGATVIKGGAAMLARYMDESRSIPTATSFRTVTVSTLDTRRRQLKEAGCR
jgi:2-oxoglutarate dehydrogenase E1 component